MARRDYVLVRTGNGRVLIEFEQDTYKQGWEVRISQEHVADARWEPLESIFYDTIEPAKAHFRQLSKRVLSTMLDEMTKPAMPEFGEVIRDMDEERVAF